MPDQAVDPAQEVGVCVDLETSREAFSRAVSVDSSVGTSTAAAPSHVGHTSDSASNAASGSGYAVGYTATGSIWAAVAAGPLGAATADAAAVTIGALGSVETPEFVPPWMAPSASEADAGLVPSASSGGSKFQRALRKAEELAAKFAGCGGCVPDDWPLVPGAEDSSVDRPAATTVLIAGIPDDGDAHAFRRKLDEWGLAGTYDLFYVPSQDALWQGFSEGAWGDCGRLAVVNFVRPEFSSLCAWLFQAGTEGQVFVAAIQGHQENVVYCGRLAGRDPPPGHAPVVFQDPDPNPWAEEAAEALLTNPEDPILQVLAGGVSRELKGQFRKTKLCGYFRKKRACRLGDSCPFAHTTEELQPLPDLQKTRLCFAYLRGKCKDPNCRYAHGRKELRATDYFYKTELCHWWFAGSCKAGASCRYAHGEDDLRPGGGGAEPEEGWPEAFWQGAWSQTPEQMGQPGPTMEVVPPAGSDLFPSPGRSTLRRTSESPERTLARSNRTFMEALGDVKTREFEPLEYELPKRSFSCGDIEELAKAMAEVEECEEEDSGDELLVDGAL